MINIEDRILRMEQKLDRVLNYIDNLTAPSPYNLYEWLEKWLEIYRKPYIKPHSYKNLCQVVRIHIKPNIKDCNLNDLTAESVQSALNSVKTTRMRKYTYDVYHASLFQAYRLEYMRKNIMLNIDAPRHIRKIGRALTQEEQEQFLKAIQGNKLEYLYKFYILSGVRMSEAFSITTADILQEKGIIHIAGTKTKQSDRYIPLFLQLQELLQKIKPLNNFYFPYNANIVTCNFKRIKKKYGFTFTIHSLRHTFATRCLECGISLKIVQQWLGHSKLDTTANIYTHIQNEFE